MHNHSFGKYPIETLMEDGIDIGNVYQCKCGARSVELTTAGKLLIDEKSIDLLELAPWLKGKQSPDAQRDIPLEAHRG